MYCKRILLLLLLLLLPLLHTANQAAPLGALSDRIAVCGRCEARGVGRSVVAYTRRLMDQQGEVYSTCNARSPPQKKQKTAVMVFSST